MLDGERSGSFVHLPPILSETSKLFVPSTKTKKYKDQITCLTARERPKPKIVMCRTKPAVFAPLGNLNRLQHEELEGIIARFENDSSYEGLRTTDRLLLHFELLEKLASSASPIQPLLNKIYYILCNAAYDCPNQDNPQALIGNEYMTKIKKIDRDPLDMELHELQIEIKKEKARLKCQTAQLDELKKTLLNAKSTQKNLENEVSKLKELLRRDEDLYEHLLRDELALDRTASLHRLQLIEAKQMYDVISEKANSLHDDFRDTMCLLHEKETEQKHDQEIATTVQELTEEQKQLDIQRERLTKEISELHDQLAKDNEIVVKRREELRLAQIDLQELEESSADLHRSHTPRPAWGRVFESLPEVAYADPINQAPDADPRIQKKKWLKQGRTQVFVKEMCHWLQRIQGDCGMSLQLARLTNETEAARLELSTLQAQMEILQRRQRRQYQTLPLQANGVPSLAAVAKTVAAANKLLGATGNGFTNGTTEPSNNPLSHRDFITALGTTPEIPQFLRHTGRVRNRHISKTELEKIIRTVWNGKKAKEAHMGIKIQLDEYLYEVLKTKFGIQTIIAEWGYNILQGLKTYSWDSEVELFFLCLTGAVSETIYFDQDLMLEECRNILIRLNDSYYDAMLKCDPKRVYLNDIMLTLHNFFPMKTPLQLKSIERELLKETKSKEKTLQGIAGETLIAIDDLFPLKQRGGKGYFVKILRTQHFKEIQDYLALLDRKIREADPHHLGRVEIKEIKAAMQAIDATVTDTWLAECIMRGVPKRLVGQMDMSSVVEYRIFFKKMNLKLMKHSLNFFPKAQIASFHSTPPSRS